MSALIRQSHSNNSDPLWVSTTGGTINGNLAVTGVIAQQNSGILMGLELTVPIVIAAGPGGVGGTATKMALALEPIGAAPHASVALRTNFYDVNGALIFVQDIL